MSDTRMILDSGDNLDPVRNRFYPPFSISGKQENTHWWPIINEEGRMDPSDIRRSISTAGPDERLDRPDWNGRGIVGTIAGT